MKRMFICSLLGLALLAAGRRLRTTADDALAAAVEAQASGNHARAVECYRQALARGADPVRVGHNHGAALYALARYAEAEEEFHRAAEGGGLRAARAAYNQGNCLVQQACPADQPPSVELLARAAQQYAACLDQEDEAAQAGPLFADARHNLELTKQLLARAVPPEQSPLPENAIASPDPSQPKEELIAQADRPDAAAAGAEPEEECPT
jgi:tetratricopeptide (TPR) repeat protein